MKTTLLRMGVLLAATAMPVAAQGHAHEHMSPYAGMEGREIKALSTEEIQGLLAGEGLGMALPAELNGYPGPRHVLDMSERLGLTPDQERQVSTIYEEMLAQARDLGARLVALERSLDESFAKATITEPQLEEAVEAIADTRGRLRATHLRAHLRLYPVLTAEQRAEYWRARGYGD